MRTEQELKLLKFTKYKCERDFLFFVRYFFHKVEGTKFIVNGHHEVICNALLNAYDHKTKRLLINCPPRYSKTELVVIMFIAWSLAKNPSSRFIHLSYSDELALDNSTRVKELIECDEYQTLWPVHLKKSTQSKSLWRTEEGGGLKAGAAGGTVTGFGAGVNDEEFGGAILIDDPLKPDDADYDVMRKRVNRRLNTTIKSRCNSRSTPIVMIMQRLHDDDPAGFVLNGGTGEQWDHIKIPVRNADGSPLWEFRHKDNDLQAIQKADKRVWNGQYMQEPIPDEGDYFLADNARWYNSADIPEHLNVYGCSDYAVTQDAGDFTEHGIFGVCPKGNIYIMDWWSGQTSSDVWVEEQIDLIAKHKPQLWGGETGPIKNAVEPWLRKRMDKRKKFVAMKWVSHATANYKVAGARGFQAIWDQKIVYLPEDKEWAHELLRQLTRFPLGTLDDKVDTCSIFAKIINRVWEQTPPEEPKDETIHEVESIVLEDFATKRWGT